MLVIVIAVFARRPPLLKYICFRITKRLPIWVGLKRKLLLPIGDRWDSIASKIKKRANDVLPLSLLPKLFYGENIIARTGRRLRGRGGSLL